MRKDITIQTEPWAADTGKPFKVVNITLTVDKDSSGVLQYSEEDLAEFMPVIRMDLSKDNK